jgi:hypothetical protein
MRNKNPHLQVKLLTFVSITIIVNVWIHYHLTHRKISETCETLDFVSKSNSRVAETKIERLKETLQIDSKNLKKQLSNIESQMAQVQSNIQYLINNQYKTASTPEVNRQAVIENNAVNIKATDSNEYKTKTDDSEEQMKSMIQNKKPILYEREALLQLMTQDKESDPEWSMEASASIYDAFSDNEINSGIQLDNVECGATLCQANLFIDGTTGFENSYSEILDQIPWHGQGFSQINEESGRIDFYVAREGYALPYLEN